MSQLRFYTTVAFGISLSFATYVSDAAADVWKCMSPGQKSPSFTDAPTGADGVTCEKVQGETYTRGEGSGTPAKKAPSAGGSGGSGKSAKGPKQKVQKSKYGPSKRKRLDTNFGGSKNGNKKKSH